VEIQAIDVKLGCADDMSRVEEEAGLLRGASPLPPPS